MVAISWEGSCTVGRQALGTRGAGSERPYQMPHQNGGDFYGRT